MILIPILAKMILHFYYIYLEKDIIHNTFSSRFYTNMTLFLVIYVKIYLHCYYLHIDVFRLLLIIIIIEDLYYFALKIFFK